MNSVAGGSYRRTRIKVAIGVVGISVTMGVVAACSGGPTTQGATPTTTAPPTATAPAKGGQGRHGLIGQITAENGSTWTINARSGTQYTVTITPQTQFGTRRMPGTAQQFPVGSTVRVRGTANGSTVTANRITATTPRHPANTAPSSPPG
jgi:uncharacterized protein DUF5666